MYQYRPVKEHAYDPDIGGFTTYGLALYRDGELLCHQADVSVDLQVVRHMADLFTAEQVEPVHMMDAILDMLP